MQSKSLLLSLAAVVLISGISYAGWRYVRGRENQICRVCDRPVHSHARAVAVFHGKRIAYCCPACALSQYRQTGAAGKIVSVTDYQTHADVDPDEAFLVRGSDVNACAGRAATPGMDKHPMQPVFDRCSPSLLAFSSRPAAEAFAREHGGQVIRMPEALAQ